MISDTRQRIVEEAKALFGSKGFSDTSMSEIADAVGIKKPSLYHFFANKEEIYSIALVAMIEEVTAIFHGASRVGSPDEMKGVIKKVLKKGLQVGVGLITLKNSIQISDPKMERVVIRKYGEMLNAVEEYLELMGVKDTTFVSQLLVDCQQMYILRRTCGVSQSSVDRYSTHLADLVTSYR